MDDKFDDDISFSLLAGTMEEPLILPLIEIIDPAQYPSWLAFLEGIKSRSTYQDRLKDFLEYRGTLGFYVTRFGYTIEIHRW